MGIFSKKIGSVFLKESSDTADFIEKLDKLKDRASGETKVKIEKQINLAKRGQAGENNVAFELKNSGIDMYILHDIYLEAEDLTAQIDYLVVTRKYVYIIECKNLIGDIAIDNDGNFTRTYEVFGRKVREGIYSPITQNERHMTVLKEIVLQSKGNFLSKMMFEKNFESEYNSVVVLANPQTCLNAKFAKKEVREQVIRADQLIHYIKERNELYDGKVKGEKEMQQIANFFLGKDVRKRSDYTKKYEELVECMKDECGTFQEERDGEQARKPEYTDTAILPSADKLRTELKDYRLKQSKLEGIKPYYIFNNDQMESLIVERPKTIEDLLTVSGFGQKKVEKYGEAILAILRGERNV